VGPEGGAGGGREGAFEDGLLEAGVEPGELSRGEDAAALEGVLT
jgi:hypothetical protein